jgi:hypothetical protein
MIPHGIPWKNKIEVPPSIDSTIYTGFFEMGQTIFTFAIKHHLFEISCLSRF